MLRRLYIDNYKSLVNFELVLGATNLLMGANGSGKTSVFSALSDVRSIVFGGQDVEDVLPAASRTRWQTRLQQVFELTLDDGDQAFDYHLEVSHETKPPRISRETLRLGDVVLYQRVDDTVEVREGPGTSMLVEPGRSGLHALASITRYPVLARFVARLGRVHILSPNPASMHGWSESEASGLACTLENFASWYRYLGTVRAPEMGEAREMLKEVLDGFHALRLVESGHHPMGRALVSEWRHAGGFRVTYAFDELSYGQRVLIALYVLLFAHGEDETTIAIDEPDNFVALPEIQPWLGALSEPSRLQSLLISHHPEVLNIHAVENGHVFRRRDGGPTRVSRFTARDDETLTPAELIARRWDDVEE